MAREERKIEAEPYECSRVGEVVQVSRLHTRLPGMEWRKGSFQDCTRMFDCGVVAASGAPNWELCPYWQETEGKGEPSV